MLRSQNKMLNYSPESYSSEIINQYWFSDTTTTLNQHAEFLERSQVGGLGQMFQQQFSPPSYQLMSNSGSSVSGHSQYFSVASNQSSFDGDEIKSKLQQLERELLNDSDDDMMNGSDEMGIDDEWVTPIKELLVPNSPKESSDSNLSSSLSPKDAKTPKQLLFECAASISEDNFDEASISIAELRKMVSIQGDPPQRLAAYLVEGLVARMASSGRGLYKALKCKEPPTNNQLSAMQVLFEICPCFKFGFLAANVAILEASKDEHVVHIVDFDMSQGSQYITLIQILSKQVTKPHLRLTGVDDPESVQRSVGGLKVIGRRLEELAGVLRVPFEFRAVASKIEDVTPEMLGCRAGEALVVNFAYQLHHMPDESVSTVNQRDQLLRMVKGLQPKLVMVVEQDVNTNTAPFFPRFVEVYNYYNAVFESLDATLPRDNHDRMNVEKQCLAREIVNIVACEGTDRIERYEAAGKWRARMRMAGFTSCPLSSYVNGALRGQLKKYCDRYKIKEEAGTLGFGWEDKVLVVASAWK